MRVYLRKTLTGCTPADEASAEVLKKFSMTEVFEADVKTRRTRSLAWHRRYWALVSLIYQNSEAFKSTTEVHEVLKLETGLVKTIALRSTGEIVKIPDSIAFDKMDADAWAEYWKKVCDVVHQHILPGIDIAEMENEIASIAS